MLTEDTPIYRAMYTLTRLLIKQRNKFDKTFKYVVGERMVNVALDCLTLVHQANTDRRSGKREEHIMDFLTQLDILKTLIMICRDEKQLKSLDDLAQTFMLTADVERQATAWRRASRKPESTGSAKASAAE